MDTKSFYNLDYIIEINEKRHEQYTSAYQKVLERFTIIILIYSALTIFLITLIKELLSHGNRSIYFIISFIFFAVLLIISIIFTIKLIMPVNVAYLEIPKKYYEEIRLQYEQTITDKDQIKELLKASYITELESAVVNNEIVFRRKSSFFYNALIFGLLSVIPYLICLGFYITKKEDNIQKIEIVNADNSSIFNMKNINLMSNNKTNNTQNSSSIATTTATHLPGVNNSQVIISTPNMIKENSKNSGTIKK